MSTQASDCLAGLFGHRAEANGDPTTPPLGPEPATASPPEARGGDAAASPAAEPPEAAPVTLCAVPGPGGGLALLCLSAAIAERIEAGRPALEALLGELGGEDEGAGDVLDWPDFGEPVEPDWTCTQCGGIGWWEDLRGGRHCVDCDRRKLTRCLNLAERAARLRSGRDLGK